jgi:hypothetical protein
MQVLLSRLAVSVSLHRKAVLAVWAALIVGGGYFALHQQDNLQGGGWEVPGSQAKRANQLLRGFNGYSVAGLAIVVSAPTSGSSTTSIDGKRYRAMICCLPASSLFGAFGTEPAQIAAQIARDARVPGALASDVRSAQPPGDTTGPFATGKTLSNLCADVIQLQTPAEIAAAAASVPPGWRALVLSPQTTPPTAAACKLWGVPPAPRSQRAPVKSSIPAIVFTDEWDHVIYPGEGSRIATKLGNARLYEFPGLDHIALLNFLARDVSCPRQIALAFLAQPSVFPGSVCASTMVEPPLAPPR